MKKFMAANWKMHKTRDEAKNTVRDLVSSLADMPADREVVVFAPFTALCACSGELEGKKGFSLGAQNFYPEEQGAFTGEISLGMLRDVGCAHVLAGHSERRSLFREDSVFIGKKTAYALRNDFKVTLCIGETLEERENGRLEAVLGEQLVKGLAEVYDAVSENDLAIAYEPVWAIGTGRVAGPADILEAHALVRRLLRLRFPAQGAAIRILYGGSVKPENTPEIITLDNVDGVLVGGASLDAASMRRIVLA